MTQDVRLRRERLFHDPEGELRPTRRRPCLCCSREFDSKGAGNRMCVICRAKAADVSPYAL